MSCKIRFVIAISATVGCLSVPLSSQGQERVEYLLRSETGLTGTFLDPLHKQPVWFDASAEDGVFTLHLGLNAQSLILRFGQGEFHLSSSNNTVAGFSTLSDEEKETLRQLAIHLGKELEAPSPFDASVTCAIRNLSSLPTDMPLSVSVDSVTKTVGEDSVPMEDIREARREAMNDLNPLFGAEDEISTKTIASLCSNIGSRRAACYPTSLVPYREKCDNVIIGGTSCTGRCGTLCNGLCTGQRYTKDCHNHDRCADVYGTTHRYCNFIFNSTFDDCASAPNCTDLPGVWNITYTWPGFPSRSTALNVFPSRKITTGEGPVGAWNVANNTATLTFTGGCKPVYTGTLSSNRQAISGTMRCTTGNDNGTWSATKTNGVLPTGTSTKVNDPAAAPDGHGMLLGPPD